MIIHANAVQFSRVNFSLLSAYNVVAFPAKIQDRRRKKKTKNRRMYHSQPVTNVARSFGKPAALLGFVYVATYSFIVGIAFHGGKLVSLLKLDAKVTLAIITRSVAAAAQP